MKVVLDIETAGFDFETLDSSQQEYLLRYAEKEADETIRNQKIDDAKRYLSLYPFTAQIVAIGMMKIESGKMLVLYDGENGEEWYSEDERIKYKSMPEVEMLKTFWDTVEKITDVITFNGRNFDLPFLTMRSAILGIKPSYNFNSKKRSARKRQIDLLDELTFKGALRKFNLDFYCRAFEIKSPKDGDVTGMEVRELFRAGKVKEIAHYCACDVTATHKLYLIREKYLNI